MAGDTGPKSFLDLVNIIDKYAFWISSHYCHPDLTFNSVPDNFDFSTLWQLLLPSDSRPHGIMDPSIVSQMPWTADFTLDHEKRIVQLGTPTTASKDQVEPTKLSQAFQATIKAAIDLRRFSILTKHSEMYRLMGSSNFVTLERFAAPLFGIAGRGAHMTAFVRTSTGLKIWVPRRAKHLVTYPGMLDTTVAGGVKADQSPMECIVAEANEEASLPTSFVQENALPVGAITHCLKSKRSGLFSIAVLYMYDIELPETMIPAPGDDEVEGFELMTVKEVKNAMFKQELKPNSSLVMMDFFIRHGIMSEENEPGYAEISARLRRRLPVAITPLGDVTQ